MKKYTVYKFKTTHECVNPDKNIHKQCIMHPQNQVYDIVTR